MAGKYEFAGLAPPAAVATLFPDKNGTAGTAAERVSAELATHALVFQYTTIGRDGRRLPHRVVGIHPVRNLNADLLHELFWETIYHLKVRSKMSVVMAICDGGRSADRR